MGGLGLMKGGRYTFFVCHIKGPRKGVKSRVRNKSIKIFVIFLELGKGKLISPLGAIAPVTLPSPSMVLSKHLRHFYHTQRGCDESIFES